MKKALRGLHTRLFLSALVIMSACDEPLPVSVGKGPEIVLSAPGSAAMETDFVLVQGVARDEEGVVAMSYTLNDGQPQPIEIAAGTEVAFEFLIEGLAPGEYELRVLADDSRSNRELLELVFTIAQPTLDPSRLGFREVFSGLGTPVHLTAPEGDDLIYVVDQVGVIRVVEDGAVRPQPFLDISSQLTAGGEEGLLGLAFHPRYAENGHFFVYFTDLERESRVARFTVSADRRVANRGSEKQILFADQPEDHGHHKAGTMFFGRDGMLYIALGDGAGAVDYYQHAQNPGTLLGGVLRIDVDGGDPYAIPRDNPLVTSPGARGELWAMGLRNPWRISTDRVTGAIYIPDVGENDWEEINVIAPAASSAANFGWPVVEGNQCVFRNPNCDVAAFAAPVLQYSHEEGCSVTGGVVYRGRAIPELRGHYLYSDFCQGFVRSFRYVAGRAEDRLDWGLSPGSLITAIGEDGKGEIYFLTANGRALVLERVAG